MTALAQIKLKCGSVVATFGVAVAHAPSVQDLANTFNSSASAEIASAIELHAAFIRYCVDCGSSEDALAVFDAFCTAYDTATCDIHVVVQAQDLDEAAARRVLRGYFSAWPLVNTSSVWPTVPAPALFAAAKSTGLMALFGGQRGTSDYLDEAAWLLNVYYPLLLDFMSYMSEFLHRESQDTRVSSVYDKGLDVLRWLTTPGTMPDEQYLLTIPVCQPLVALIQLMHVMVLYKTLGISPEDLTKRFKVAVGHSQGIGIAAAFSTLTDEQSFYNISERILGIHLVAGAFPQLRYPCYKTPTDSSSGAEVRPMVSVQGVTKPALEQFIAKFNRRQPSPAKHAFLAVVNTVDQFIVASEATSAAKFVEFLRSESADPDKDQSRIPFAQRKPVIAVQYTTITAPYHCLLLESATDEAHDIAVEKEWILHSSDMQIAVRASDDGHDIRSEPDLTRYLFGAICVLPVDWLQATQCPSITHIVDFGPGGLSGFGVLAYKNVE
ncbi:fatty acid synthase alpha subunit Lsd1, partial [Coemansia sp. BCRC 34301]